MLTLYKSLIRPLLEYSSPLWSPIAKGDIQRLEEIQHSFIRKIKGVDRNYMTALNQLNLYSLEKRRDRYAIIHIWKMLEKQTAVLSHIQIQTDTSHRRGRTLLPFNLAKTPAYLQKARQQTIRCRGIRLFNNLPQNIRNLKGVSLLQFKGALDRYFVHKPTAQDSTTNTHPIRYATPSNSDTHSQHGRRHALTLVETNHDSPITITTRDGGNAVEHVTAAPITLSQSESQLGRLCQDVVHF